MDPLAVDLRRDVVERVEPRLLRPPVEVVAPVAKQLVEVREVGALVPADAGDLVGEARAYQALMEVVENLVRDCEERGRLRFHRVQSN